MKTQARLLAPPVKEEFHRSCGRQQWLPAHCRPIPHHIHSLVPSYHRKSRFQLKSMLVGSSRDAKLQRFFLLAKKKSLFFKKHITKVQEKGSISNDYREYRNGKP